MSIILLLPGIISFRLVLRGRVETAFLSVYLPSLLLLPQDYSYRIPHLPPFSAAEFALMPIGFVAFWQHLRGGSFRLMDALVFLFWVSWSLSEIVGEPVMNDGILSAVSAIVFYLLAYATGRRLIEPDLRLETVRRIVIFILLLGPIGLYEWRFLQSPYALFEGKVLHIPPTSLYAYSAGAGGIGVQVRNGRGRMSVSLGGGELAGIVIAVTFALNAWLVFLNKERTKFDLGKRFAKLQKYHLPGLLLVFYLWLTQSRGPMIALAAGFPVLQIPRFKNPKLAIGLVATLLIAGGLGAQQYFSRYTEVKGISTVGEEQASAIYRREMLIAYQSIAEMGGWLGWGGSGIPTVGGMKSIDNQFLLVHLMQGEFGYIVWILIVVESVRTGVARILTLQALEDRAFACSALAALAILWISYYTVYMGAQLPQITFLLLGWSQSITAARTSTASVTVPVAQPKLAFQRVLR
ncbi:MAG: hypothetical protein JO121_30920 [Deltaproteobacteria bacterium]|nr:hypothetical protein [Deltaproteobacteria bacterium]